MRYTLLLRYDDHKFYLAPRFSIAVEEPSDFESVEFGSGCCGSAGNRTWHFVLRFVGNCSLAASWTLYNQLTAFLDQACATGVDLILERTVWDEPTLQWRVSKPQATMIDTVSQFTRERILTIDLKLTLTTFVEVGEGVVLVG